MPQSLLAANQHTVLLQTAQAKIFGELWEYPQYLLYSDFPFFFQLDNGLLQTFQCAIADICGMPHASSMQAWMHITHSLAKIQPKHTTE